MKEISVKIWQEEIGTTDRINYSYLQEQITYRRLCIFVLLFHKTFNGFYIEWIITCGTKNKINNSLTETNINKKNLFCNQINN